MLAANSSFSPTMSLYSVIIYGLQNVHQKVVAINSSTLNPSEISIVVVLLIHAKRVSLFVALFVFTDTLISQNYESNQMRETNMEIMGKRLDAINLEVPTLVTLEAGKKRLLLGS